MELNIYYVLAGWMALAVLLWLFPGYWRGTNKNFERMLPYWPYSEALWRGMVRSYATVTLAWASMFAVVTYGLIVGDENMHPWVVSGWVALLAAQLGAWGTVMLFNRPKFLVPPRLRHEPGAIEAWWRAERKAQPKARRSRWLAHHLMWGTAYLVNDFASGSYV